MSNSQKIDRIIGGGLLASDYAESGKGVLERKVEALKSAGVTHVVVNQALVSIPWVMDPENSYLRFTTLGPTPDQYVSSTYNVGLYHDSLLTQNRKLLLSNAALARKYGFRCAMLARPDLTDAQRECLRVQKDSFAQYPAGFRRQCNWIRASFYKLSDETVPPGTPSFREIVAAEIAVSSEMLAAAGKDPAQDPRIRLMRAHVGDPIRTVDLTAFPKNRHMGTKGWTGAHEVADE